MKRFFFSLMLNFIYLTILCQTGNLKTINAETFTWSGAVAYLYAQNYTETFIAPANYSKFSIESVWTNDGAFKIDNLYKSNTKNIFIKGNTLFFNVKSTYFRNKLNEVENYVNINKPPFDFKGQMLIH